MSHWLLTLASTADEATTAYVRDLLMIMVAAAAVAIVAPRVRLSSIPGYLLLGALIGPSMLGLIKTDDNVRQIAGLAIVLLMFTIGLHLDTGSIRSGMVSIIVVGVASTLGSAAMLWPTAMLFGASAPKAMAIALALAMSSTAVVLGLLNQRREIHRVHGRLCLGIALVQDLIAVGVLAVLPLLATWEHGAEAARPARTIGLHGLSPTLELVQSAAFKIGIIGVLVAAGRWVLPGALKQASRNANTEALLVVASTSALAAAVVTVWLGFGPALGAFLAGFLLSSTPFRHQLAGQLSPMRDLFMAVFFTAVGTKVDVPAALESWWLVAMGVVALLAVKSSVIGFTTWAGGATAPIAALTGLLLSQAGEFSLVILGQAQLAGLVDEHAQAVLISVVVVTLVLTTPLYELAKKIQPWLDRFPPARWITNPALHEHGAPPTDAGNAAEASGTPAPMGIGGPDVFEDALPYPHRPVIIAGFGVVGRNVAEHFAAAGIPYVVIELNPSTVIKQQRLGRRFVFGDIANVDVLESAGVHAAEAVILTIPDDDAVLRACRTIRSLAPSIFIAARTTYLSRAIAATELGANYVCVEEVVTAQDMAKQVMEKLARRLVEHL